MTIPVKASLAAAALCFSLCGCASWNARAYVNQPVERFVDDWGSPFEQSQGTDGNVHYRFHVKALESSLQDACVVDLGVDASGITRSQKTTGYCNDKLARHTLVTKRKLRESERRAQETASLVIPADTISKGDSVETAKVRLRNWALLSERKVTTSDGVETGYELLEYRGNPPDIDTRRVTFIFWNGRLQYYVPVESSEIEPVLFDDFVNSLFKARKIKFRDSIQLKHDKWFELHGSQPDVYEQELYLYQLWQAQRVDNKASTVDEYEYLVIQKNRQLEEAKRQVQMNERMVAAAEHNVQIQREAAEMQRQEAAAGRRAILSAAMLTAFRPTYNPRPITSVTCTSNGYGNYVSTTCY